MIHIGANEGQEREHYSKYGLQKVLWIEADPEAFKKLKKNIASTKNQKALNYLVLDKKKINNFIYQMLMVALHQFWNCQNSKKCTLMLNI